MEERSAFDEELQRLNAIIVDRKELEKRTDGYYAQSMATIQGVIEPIQNRIIAGLQRRHLLPSLITKKWLLKLQNYVLCEAHRDKMEYYFKNKQ